MPSSVTATNFAVTAKDAFSYYADDWGVRINTLLLKNLNNTQSTTNSNSHNLQVTATRSSEAEHKTCFSFELHPLLVLEDVLGDLNNNFYDSCVDCTPQDLDKLGFNPHLDEIKFETLGQLSRGNLWIC